jgi:hypothetical protein
MPDTFGLKALERWIGALVYGIGIIRVGFERT